jgi:imidazole glycerol phosphate synthase glutamine amidotransferase subunit
MKVTILSTGTANLASMTSALRRLGAEVVLAERPADVADAEHLVVPGVGAFEAAIGAVRAGGFEQPLRDRVQAGRSTLAVCVGLQILARASTESPGIAGLGIVDADVQRLPPTVEVPQLGWNRLSTGDAMYFANSYALREAPGFGVVTAEHGERFVAALSRGRVLACQFHPELSGEPGERWLSDWLAGRALRDGGTRADGLARRVVPCLDIRNGRVVKGVRFQGLRDAGDPVEAARRYQEQGADELVMLDVSATPEGRANAAETVRAVRAALGIALTVGGGVRSVEDADRLLRAGADKVAVNTAAVADPGVIDRLAGRFGRQCIVLSLDAAVPRESMNDRMFREVVTHSGSRRTGRSAAEWAREAVDRGAGEVLLTSWDRDGTGDGYDLPLIRSVRDAVSVPIVASGGADGPDAMVDAFAAGASAVLAASIFHDGVHTVRTVHDRLSKAGVQVVPGNRRNP